MDEINHEVVKKPEDYTESDLSALFVEIEILESKASDLRTNCLKYENENSRLKYLATEKEFELKKLQTKRKYLDMSIELGKEELEFKSKKINEKRYSTKNVLNLLVYSTVVASRFNSEVDDSIIHKLHESLKNFVEKSEGDREVSGIHGENKILQRRRDCLESEIDRLKNRVEFLKNEISKQEQNNIFKWIVEMSDMAVKERRLYKMWDECLRQKNNANNNNKLIGVDCATSDSLNSSSRSFLNPQLPPVKRVQKQNCQIAPYEDGDNSYLSTTFSINSSRNEQKMNAPSVIYGQRRPSMEHLNDVSKLLNDPLDISQCSMLSIDEVGVHSNDFNDEVMEFEQVISPSPVQESKNKANNSFQNTSSNCETPEEINNVMTSSRNSDVDISLDMSCESFTDCDEMSNDVSKFGITSLFDTDCQENDPEKSFPDMENKLDDEDFLPNFDDYSSLINLDEDLSNSKEALIENFDCDDTDLSKKVLFNDEIGISETTPSNELVENFGEIENNDSSFIMNNFEEDEFCLQDEDLFKFGDSSDLSPDNGGINEGGNSFNFDFDMFDDISIDNDLDSLNDGILDNLMSGNNDDLSNFNNTTDFKDLFK